MSAEQEYDRVYKFFQGLLRQGSPYQLCDEYPLVFNESTAQLYHVELDDGADLSHVSKYLQEITSDSVLLYVSQNGVMKAGLAALRRQVEYREGEWMNAFFVGSVVTHPDSRQQGLQRFLFEILAESAKQREIDALILWSNQTTFYEKLGFFLGGLQGTWSTLINKPLISNPVKVELAESKDVSFSPKWYQAFDSKPCRVRRSFEEMQKLFQIPGMKIAYTENAYALFGKAEDFQGVCHEWAGPGVEAVSCIERFRSENPLIRVLSPGVLSGEDELKVTQMFQKESWEARLEYLGLIKLTSSRLSKESFDPQNLQYPFFIWGCDSI